MSAADDPTRADEALRRAREDDARRAEIRVQVTGHADRPATRDGAAS